MNRILIFPLFLGLLHHVGICQSSQQTVMKDYDVISIPLMQSAAPEGADLQGDSLQEMGLSLNPIEKGDGSFYPQGEIEWIKKDRIRLRLKPGEAIRLFSQPIPLPRRSAHFTCIASVSGEKPSQAGMAFIDSKNTEFLSASLLYDFEIPKEEGELSFEYQPNEKLVYLLLQFVGPETGESVITLQRIRIASGYREIEFALGDTQLGDTVHFGDENVAITTNAPPSTAGGYKILSSDNNRTRFPQSRDRALLVGTQSDEDVIQLMIPINPGAVEIRPSTRPRRLYGEAYIKKVAGETGIFSLALLSGTTTSITYTDIPIGSLTAGRWLRIESPLLLAGPSLQPPIFLILQIRHGDAQILVDDLRLRARWDSLHYWDANTAASP
ncbi:hypothetical protein GF373_12715 [bacterium]|nr:hypothetical protein [bacterium]